MINFKSCSFIKFIYKFGREKLSDIFDTISYLVSKHTNKFAYVAILDFIKTNTKANVFKYAIVVGTE